MSYPFSATCAGAKQFNYSSDQGWDFGAWVQPQRAEGNASTVRGQVREWFRQSTTCCRLGRTEKRSEWAIGLKKTEGWGDGRPREKDSCHGNQKLNCF